MDNDFDFWTEPVFSDLLAEEQICGNCQHWGREQILSLRLQTATGPAWWEVAPCLRDAVEPDAGPDALILLSENSNCLQHADLFEPSLEFCLEYKPRHNQFQCQSNGVLPGRDFPASLTPSKHDN